MPIEVKDKAKVNKKRRYSKEEKRAYYKAWESSGMKKARFCKENGLPVEEFYYWHKLFKMPASRSNVFLAAVAKPLPQKAGPDVAKIDIRLPNQAQLTISLAESQLISFIQELCHAVTIIR